jgi:hypothetical protein
MGWDRMDGGCDWESLFSSLPIPDAAGEGVMERRTRGTRDPTVASCMVHCRYVWFAFEFEKMVACEYPCSPPPQ